MSIFGKSEPKPVAPDEQILGYDKDHLAEYREYQAAEELLSDVNKKGFRKPNNRQIERARETIHEYRRKKAETFLEEHKARISYFGIEIKAHFDELPNGLIKPSISLAPFDPFKQLAPVKPWSEAMEENLATRINCKHKPMEDNDDVCGTCGVARVSWGENNEGVTNEFIDRARAKIDEQKAAEAACSRGEHVKDEVKDHCVHCRKPVSEWEKKEEAAEQQEHAAAE